MCPHILYISTYLYMSTCLVHVHLSCTFPYRKAQSIWSCHSVLTSQHFQQCNAVTLRVQQNVVWHFLYSAYEDTVFWKAGLGYPVARRRSTSDNKYRIAFNDTLLTSYTSPWTEARYRQPCTVCVTIHSFPSSFDVAANKHGEWFSNCRWFSSVQQSCNTTPDLCTSCVSEH